MASGANGDDVLVAATATTGMSDNPLLGAKTEVAPDGNEGTGHTMSRWPQDKE
jgi:hypothetical protein